MNTGLNTMESEVAALIERAARRNSPPLSTDQALASAEALTVAAGQAARELLEAANRGDRTRVAEREAQVKDLTNRASEAIQLVEELGERSAEETETASLMSALRRGDMQAVRQHQAVLTRLVNSRGVR